ncbi:MAG: hypothetical protein M3Y65_19005 [Pseudomonadota bacterium]|nr:hypothetical protein [Pseudomonadota bacterium]
MKLTKEQKEKVIADLSIIYGVAKLQCDGFEVALQVQRFGGIKYRVMTYVNGTIRGEWCSAKNNAPESKFFRKVVRLNVSTAKRLKLEKDFGKRFVAKDKYINGSFSYYLPDWTSGRAAINHLCKVCESVEIISSSNPLTATDDQSAETLAVAQ